MDLVQASGNYRSHTLRRHAQGILRTRRALRKSRVEANDIPRALPGVDCDRQCIRSDEPVHALCARRRSE